MSWIAISEDDVKTALSDTELQKFRATALAGGQTDPVAPSISTVVNKIRGYLRAVGDVESGEKIPESLKDAALALLVFEIPSRVGGMVIDPKGYREKRRTEALDLLKDVAAGRFGIEDPVVLANETIGRVDPTFEGREMEFGKENEDGI